VKGWQSFQDDTEEFTPTSYLFDARRFSHKVFAMLDAFESGSKYVVWVDADMVYTNKLTARFVKRLLDGEMCAYLGRNKCYTETGFLAFNTQHPDFAELKKRLTALYIDRLLFILDYWIDCTAFDQARRDLSGANLTPDAMGMINVFDLSPLASIMTHKKGSNFDRYAA
jgi:hypothetical protein